MTSQGQSTIRWGILLSMLHIYLQQFEVIPAFIGYFLIMKGTYELCNEVKLDYMDCLKGESTRLFVCSVIYWITGLFFGYGMAIQKLILIVFYLFDILFWGNYFNKIIKYYKERLRMDEADQLRKRRMKIVKIYFALIIFLIITLLPNLLNFLSIGGPEFIDLLASILQYIFLYFMVVMRLLLSILVQTYKL